MPGMRVECDEMTTEERLRNAARHMLMDGRAIHTDGVLLGDLLARAADEIVGAHALLGQICRADLPPTADQIMADPRVRALVIEATRLAKFCVAYVPPSQGLDYVLGELDQAITNMKETKE